MSEDAAVAVTDGAARPAVPHEAPDGYHWEALPEAGKWAPAQPGKKCRWRGSAEHACGQPAVLVLTRGIRRPIPWNYCAEHSYGRWLEDGKVLTWKLRENTPAQ